MRIIPVFLLLLLWAALPAQDLCKITYISNEGFLLEIHGKKILIDALFDHIDGTWCDSPSKQTVTLMEGAEAPFDQIDLIAVTHKHRDHFNERVLIRHLLSNPGAMVICPNQVNDILGKHPEYETIQNRIIPLTPADYTDSSLLVSGIPVRVLRLEHSYYMEEDSVSGAMKNRHRDIENLGYLINIDGIKIFHCGDTNPLNSKEYKSYALQEESIDIAFLERMFVAHGAKGMEIINKYIQPRHTVFMHIGPENREAFVKHFKEVESVTIFEQKMDYSYYETSR